MRLFAYYALHSFKNQLKKLLKTWVLIFLAVCVAFGVMVGLIAAAIENHVEETKQEELVQEAREPEEKAEPVLAEPFLLPEVDMENISGGNNNDRILEMHKQGKSNVAIAKELGLGVGEVKLVIDLFEVI